MTRSFGKGLAAVILSCTVNAALAQELDADSAEADDSLDEIIVVGPKPGDRRRVDEDVTADTERRRILKEQYWLSVEQEEYEWRKRQTIEKPSRIKVGYDPRDDYKMRTELDMHSLPYEQTKPATLFRIGF